MVFLDNESTMDLFFNPDLVEDIKKVKRPLRIQSNSREIYVNHKSKIHRYNNMVWFSRIAITNTILLKNLTEQYRVTYDSNDHIFIVHREGKDLSNSYFIMHDSSLHYYEATKKDLVFLNTVSKNNEGFSKRQIKSAVKSRELQHTLVFTTVKELKWIIRSNQIQYCPVETEDVDNAELIWGKDVPYLKCKTTRKKPIKVTEYLIRVPKEFSKLNKDLFLTMDIFS